ncbi:MAG: hypothetical protein AAFR70_04870 [Pseudomonadota bacterium]
MITLSALVWPSDSGLRLDVKTAGPGTHHRFPTTDRIISTATAIAFALLWTGWILAEMKATSPDGRIPIHVNIPSLAAMTAGDAEPAETNAGVRRGPLSASPGREWAFGAYGGVSYTYPATVSIKNGDRTDMTVSDFGWLGRPFKSPVYYGARIQRWGLGPIGGMLDFIHAKAIARPDDQARLTGKLDGEDLPETAIIKEMFSKLEFSHGHNMLLLNGLYRFAPSWMRIRPYAGIGGGTSLPHSEFGFRKDNVRTYEYQYAGLAAQGLGGVEIQLGRFAIFLEYKFTYAPYDIPLTHRSPGWLLVTDVWQQFQDWLAGREPPGGRLRVNLATHHAVGGFLVKNANWIGAERGPN